MNLNPTLAKNDSLLDQLSQLTRSTNSLQHWTLLIFLLLAIPLPFLTMNSPGLPPPPSFLLYLCRLPLKVDIFKKKKNWYTTHIPHRVFSLQSPPPLSASSSSGKCSILQARALICHLEAPGGQAKGITFHPCSSHLQQSMGSQLH